MIMQCFHSTWIGIKRSIETSLNEEENVLELCCLIGQLLKIWLCLYWSDIGSGWWLASSNRSRAVTFRTSGYRCIVVRPDYRKHCVIPHDSAYGQASALPSCYDCYLHTQKPFWSSLMDLHLSQKDDVPWKQWITCAHEEQLCYSSSVNRYFPKQLCWLFI